MHTQIIHSIVKIYPYIFGDMAIISVPESLPTELRKTIYQKKYARRLNTLKNILPPQAQEQLPIFLHNLPAKDLISLLKLPPIQSAPKLTDNDLKKLCHSINLQFNTKLDGQNLIYFVRLCELVTGQMIDMPHEVAYLASFVAYFQINFKSSNPFSLLQSYIKHSGGSNEIAYSFPSLSSKICDYAGWGNFLSGLGKHYLNYLSPRVEAILKRAPNNLAEFHEAKAQSYPNATQNLTLARICAQYNADDYVFLGCLNATDVKGVPLHGDRAKYKWKTQTDTLPNIEVDGKAINHPKYYLMKLPIRDYHALILGKITGCCQSITGYGAAFVIDGMTRKDNGFYVLLKKKGQTSATSPKLADGSIDYNNYEIIAQAYAWRSTNNNLVFDSWESKHEKTHAIAYDMLIAFGKKLITSEDPAYAFLLGEGGKTPKSFTQQKKKSSEKMIQGTVTKDAIMQSILAVNRKKEIAHLKNKFENFLNLHKANKISFLQLVDLIWPSIKNDCDVKDRKSIKDFCLILLPCIERILNSHAAKKTLLPIFRRLHVDPIFFPKENNCLDKIYYFFHTKPASEGINLIKLSQELNLTKCEKLFSNWDVTPLNNIKLSDDRRMIRRSF